MIEDDDWTYYDAVNILALPIWRWRNTATFGDQTEAVYSNGTDHGFATETAEMVLDNGPVLKAVLFAGVRALRAELDAYVMWMAAGDHEKIIETEREWAAK